MCGGSYRFAAAPWPVHFPPRENTRNPPQKEALQDEPGHPPSVGTAENRSGQSNSFLYASPSAPIYCHCHLFSTTLANSLSHPAWDRAKRNAAETRRGTGGKPSYQKRVCAAPSAFPNLSCSGGRSVSDHTECDDGGSGRGIGGFSVTCRAGCSRVGAADPIWAQACTLAPLCAPSWSCLNMGMSVHVCMHACECVRACGGQRSILGTGPRVQSVMLAETGSLSELESTTQARLADKPGPQGSSASISPQLWAARQARHTHLLQGFWAWVRSKCAHSSLFTDQRFSPCGS